MHADSTGGKTEVNYVSSRKTMGLVIDSQMMQAAGEVAGVSSAPIFKVRNVVQDEESP
jgi:hypothetical protein